MSAPGNTPSPDTATKLIILGIYLTLVIVVLRLMPALGFLLFGLGAVGGLLYYAWQAQHALRAKLVKPDTNNFATRVRLRYEDCLEKEEKFRSEAEGIRQSISTLREDLERSVAAGKEEREHAESLIKEFEAEFNLRHAKASFFADCASKLKTLLDRYQLQESIAARKRELDALRSTNFDDEASLEETRYHLERDTIELDTITELGKEVFVSFKAEQAEELRNRLEKLRSRL